MNLSLPSPSSSRRPLRRHPIGLVVLLVGMAVGSVAGAATFAGPEAAPASVPVPTPTPGPRVPVATAARCQHLLQQFDVAWPAHQQALRANEARRDRDLGDAECQAGHFTEGVRDLRRALHHIGIKPVKVVSPAPAR